jgi:hypothetical protein
MFYLNEQEKQEEISVYKKAKYYIAKKNRQACLAIFCVKKAKFLKPAQRPARSTSPSTYKRTGKILQYK